MNLSPAGSNRHRARPAGGRGGKSIGPARRRLVKKIPLYVTGALFAALAIAGRADQPTGDAAAKRKATDRLLIAAQEICPVTGERLGSMGAPVRAKSGDRTVFLCCKSCLSKPMKPEAWKQAQKNMAEAQGVCPVMDEELPENPASIVVEGRTVFVCCKPCIKKIQKDPAKALAVVDAQLKKHAVAEAEAARK